MRNLFAKKIVNDSPQTLSKAKVGCSLRIDSLEGASCQQLRDMGFCESMEVKKLSNGRNLICTVCGVKLAVNKKLADQVLVSPV